MSRADQGPEKPRAIVHKRILEVAESKPDSSIDDIATEISAATPDLVDRVLDEYGDPGTASDQDSPDPEIMPQNGNEDKISANGQESTIDPKSLTSKQRETLSAVRERPTANQAEIAEELGVTRATVSRRLSEIPDFEWAERDRFVENHVVAADGTVTESPAPSSADPATDEDSGVGEDRGDARTSRLEEDEDSSKTAEGDEGTAGQQSDTVPVESIEARLVAIEEHIQKQDEGAEIDRLDSELVHKVVHACMESEAITSEEELAIIDYLMQ